MTEVMGIFKVWELVGILVMFGLGTFLHFFYKITGNSVVGAIFSPINESVWEHGKMLLWATVIYGLVEYFFVGNLLPAFAIAKVFALIIGLVFMYVGYYAYKLVVKKHSLLGNILLYLVCVMVVQHFSFYFVSKGWLDYPSIQGLALPLGLLLVLFYTWFTFKAPNLPIFLDKKTNTYGRVKAK